MITQKLYTLKAQQITEGIDLSLFHSASTSDSASVLSGYIASYPLYPKQYFSIAAQSMVPLSLSFLLPSSNTRNTYSKQGIIVKVDSKQWLPLDAKLDKSVFIDAVQGAVLLYCPAGGTFLRSPKTNLLFTVTQKNEPQITKQSKAQLHMLSLGKGFVTPEFNSEAVQLLQKKMRGKAKTKSPACESKEAALDMGSC